MTLKRGKHHCLLSGERGRQKSCRAIFSKEERKGLRPIKRREKIAGASLGSSGWDPVGPAWGPRFVPWVGARSHVQQLRPSVVTQVNKIYLSKEREEMQRLQFSARLLLGAARTSVGWRSLPEEASPLLCKDPTPWRGLLKCCGSSLPLGSWPSGVLIPDVSWGPWGFSRSS